MSPGPVTETTMSVTRDSRREETDTRIDAALTDENCRRIVEILHEGSETVSVRDLARQLLTASSESSTTDAESLRVRLHHVHLPKLAESDFVDWDRKEGTVSATEHPVYDSDDVSEVTVTGSGDSPVQAIRDDRRREILAIVEFENGSVTRESLARRLARRESDELPPKSLVEDIEVRLHHVHLPKLVQAGILEYDLDDGIVER